MILGKRAGLAQRYRLVLREDRVDEIAATIGSAEITRLFFDEVACATVHRAPAWPGVTIWGMLALGWAILGLAVREVGPFVGTVICGAPAVIAAAYPRFVLTLHAPNQAMWTLVSRWPRRRERAMARLFEAIRAYQTQKDAA
jgi:hypothetical protein